MSERSIDVLTALELVCALLNLLSAEAIWMSLVLHWLLPHNHCEARGNAAA